MILRVVSIALALSMLAGAGFGVSRLAVGKQPMPQAIALLEGGNPRGAQGLLRPLVRAEPRNGEAHLLLARTHLVLNDPVAAEKELKVARTLRLDRAVLNPLLAQAYTMQRRYESVLTDIPAQAAQREELITNLLLRSGAYLGLGQRLHAEASVAEAAVLAPNDVRVLIGQVKLALAGNETGQADRLMRQVVAAGPETTETLTLQAAVMSNRGDAEGAVERLGQVIVQLPFSASARIERAKQLMNMGEDRLASADLRAAGGLAPDDHIVPFLRILLLIRAGKLDDAANEFQRLAPVMDQIPRAYYFQALTASMQGRNEFALDAVRRSMKLEPMAVEGIRLGGSLALKLNRADLAVAMIGRAVAAGVQDAETFDLLGRGYFGLGQMNEAIDSFRRASVLDPGNTAYTAHMVAAQTQFGVAPVPALAEAPKAIPDVDRGAWSGKLVLEPG